MKAVYIAHAYGGLEENRRNAARWVAWAALHMGVAPVADWIVLTGELTEEHRELGLSIDCALIERVDEVWLVGGHISDGMTTEMKHAVRAGVDVRDLTHLGYERPSGPVELPEVA